MPDRPLPDLDPLRAASGLALQNGTVLLHTQRNWHGKGLSWLLFDPVGEVRCEKSVIRRSGHLPTPARAATGLGTQLDQLRGLMHPENAAEDFPLFAGFLGYEAASAELATRHAVDPPFQLPDAWLGCYDAALAFADGVVPRLHLRTPAVDDGARQRDLVEQLHEAASRPARPHDGAHKLRLPDPDWHGQAVRRIQEHLRAGETYQVNLTGFASAESVADPFEHFLRHSSQNPVAFASFLRIDGRSISSHSPERLLRIRGNQADTAPVKGTLPFTSDSATRLRESEKNRAEHLMIVDLCRNDLGRRAVSSSVRVAGLMEALQVRGIDHMVSRIQAEVRPHARGALLDSMFPGGSITGAPKQRTMQIIREVELSGRGPYTGSIGYFTGRGDMDFNIAIRTAVWQDDQVHFGCGGGIVIDSDAGEELAEARLKARSFFESFGVELPG
ncbi:aminodeoxychorismate synthase, component I [bacterium]|nr:MAG: aminodeoxychorismate synthase, component I [bacterium]